MAISKHLLRPLPYHEAMRAYLQDEEAEIWDWYASHTVRDEHAEAVRFELLKSTYRVDRETQPELYSAAETVAGKLSLDVPLTIYQAQDPSGLNASLAYVPGEAHIVLHGPVTSKLTEVEFQALLAHELSHLFLWRHENGDYLIVDQILAALTHDRLADTPHFDSARLFGLYNEIFCDRGSLFVVEDLLPVISMLVKVSTGMEEVSAESYLRQAEEVFTKQTVQASDLTHPEAFIRARSLKLIDDGNENADATIAQMIEGPATLQSLDLLAQKKIAGWTRQLIDAMLIPSWMQTETVLAHARLFFDDYLPPRQSHHPTTPQKDATPREDTASEEDPAPRAAAAIAEAIKTDDEPMQDYYCYVLLDFVTADRDLEEMPLAAALSLVEQLGLKDRFSEITRRELRLRKKQLEKIDKQKEALLANASQATKSR